MAIKVKSVAMSAEKWANNAGRAADLYAQGAADAAETWATKTANASDNYKAAIQSANIDKRFAQGVKKAGSAKYKRKIEEVAKDRYKPGVDAATTDYSSNVEPFLSTIASLTLSARKPKGDPANYKRVEEVGKALNAKRLALLGVAGSAA